MVEASVAGDAVQPRTEVDLAIIGEQGAEGCGEDLLEDILRVLARTDDPRAEREQARLVASDDDLERRLVPGARLRDQPFIAGDAEQGHGAAAGGGALLDQCVAFHYRDLA